MLLFLLSTSLVIYMGFRRMRPETWAVLFWVVTLFLAVASLVGDEASNKRERHFFNMIAPPSDIFIAQFLFGVIELFILEHVLFIVFGTFFQWHMPLSLTASSILFIGAISLSSIFTFVNALVMAADKGSVLASLLGFPLVIPVLLLLIRLFMAEMGFMTSDDGRMQDILSLIGIDILLVGMGILLYPLIWRS